MHQRRYCPSWVFALTCFFTGASLNFAAEQSYQEALDEVLAHCPEDYEAVVTPVPESGAFEEISTIELLRMLESWNPSLRVAAAKALGTRGDEVIPVLIKATEAGSGSVRAGAAAALAVIIKNKLTHWKEVYPESTNARESQEKILDDHSELADAFIRMTKDPQLPVRVSALEGLETMAPQTPEAAQAVLELCSDEDEYLAQAAMIALDKRFGIAALQGDTVIAALKQAMRSPLPRGRGHVMRIVQKMDDRSQRKFIPEMLAHLDWQPRRDTMFGAGGQEDSIRLLTKFGVKELIPRLPGLMQKAMRGPGLFMPCLESTKAFGRDAKVLLPEFREILKAIEAESANGRKGLEGRIEKLKETIAFLEKQ